MGTAFFWGWVAASSLLVGGVIALLIRIPSRVLGWIMAFGSGVLISAVAYELIGEAFDTADTHFTLVIGLFVGCAAFTIGDSLLDRVGGAHRKHSGGFQAEGSPFAIVLGIVLDGIPESIVIGLTLVTGSQVSLAFLTAVFVSNVPEAIAATKGLSVAGWRSSRVMILWFVVAAVAALAAAAGYGLLDTASDEAIAFVLAFAGGALLAMLADTMMPEAFEHGGRAVGVLTTIGFTIAFGLSEFG